MQRFIPLVEELAKEEEGRELLAMLLDDTYHVWMHNPPKLPAVGTKAKRKGSKPRGGRRSGRGGDRRRGGRRK